MRIRAGRILVPVYLISEGIAIGMFWLMVVG